jgi:adenine-specific DNA-methyltransferase
MPTLQFKGKTFVQNHHLAVKYHQLVPKKELSLTDKISLHDNLIIQGDNLKALKALLPTYAGKIKCIYIDPPYNTGTTYEKWVYSDNVNSPMIKEWLGKVVEKDDLTRHDKWLCMMMPRLKLLKELLHEEGVIFVSIDDNEESNLKILMDEIFGESNFMGKLPRRTKSGGGSAASDFAIEHDYVIVYAKDKALVPKLFIPHDPEYALRYKEEDEDGKYFWDTMERSSTATTPYKIIAPDGEVLTGKWFRAEATFLADLERGEVKFLKKKDGTWSVQFKQRMGQGRKIRSLIENEFKSNQAEYEEFGIKRKFDYPKPVSLLKEIIKASTEEDDIILDSFAGSGTTAHAVLELNKEHGSNRKFILIEMEDYSNEITAERIRKVIKGVPKSKNFKIGTGGTFSYFELGPTIEMESILQGKNLPSYEEFARYIFYTATGEEFNEKRINEKTGFIGETKNYELYMFYKPDVEWLKRNALTLDGVKAMPKFKGKQRLVFAPAKYVDDYTCLENRIDFCQLPYEIYRIQK